MKGEVLEMVGKVTVRFSVDMFSFFASFVDYRYFGLDKSTVVRPALTAQNSYRCVSQVPSGMSTTGLVLAAYKGAYYTTRVSIELRSLLSAHLVSPPPLLRRALPTSKGGATCFYQFNLILHSYWLFLEPRLLRKGLSRKASKAPYRLKANLFLWSISTSIIDVDPTGLKTGILVA